MLLFSFDRPRTAFCFSGFSSTLFVSSPHPRMFASVMSDVAMQLMTDAKSMIFNAKPLSGFHLMLFESFYFRMFRSPFTPFFTMSEPFFLAFFLPSPAIFLAVVVPTTAFFM